MISVVKIVVLVAGRAFRNLLPYPVDVCILKYVLVFGARRFAKQRNLQSLRIMVGVKNSKRA